MADLTGQCVLVTGGAQGIGRAIVLEAAAAGAAVVIMDVNAAAAAEVAAQAAALGRRSLVLVADISNDREVAAVLATMADSEIGWPSVLVNNAGIQIVAAPLDVDTASYDRTMAVNLRAVFFVSQALARRWVERKTRGVIVNIASIAGMVHFALHAAYSTSKAGVRALTGALALELAPHGIRVNAIAPGYVETPLSLTAADPAERARVEALIPLGRLAQPIDVARVAVFLASDASAYMTGQTLVVDGGFTLR